MNQKNFNLWEGVYETWDDAPGDDGVFNNDIWISKITERKQKASIIPSGAVLSGTVSYDNILPVVTAMAVASKKGVLRILDFGGGLGDDFFSLADSLRHAEKIECHVVGTEAVCRQGVNYLIRKLDYFFIPSFLKFLILCILSIQEAHFSILITGLN